MSKFDQLKRMKLVKFARVNLRWLARKTNILQVAGAITTGMFMLACTNVIAITVFAESANNVDTPLTTVTTVAESEESFDVTKPVFTEVIAGTTETTTITTKLTTITTTKATTTVTTTKATTTTEEIVEEVVYEEDPIYEEEPIYEETIVYEEPENDFEESETVDAEPVVDDEVDETDESESESDSTSSGYPALTKGMGKNDDGPSGVEKWYDLYMGKVIEYFQMETGIYSDFWIRGDGVKMYGDYVMVAANLDYRPKGTIIETSLGTGIVCDRCEGAYWGDPYLIDIAVDWKNWNGE